MTDEGDLAELGTSRSTRLGVVIVVAVLHLVAVLALVRAFAPQATQRAVEQVVAAFTVTISPPDPPPPPQSPKPAQPDPGAAGNVGKKAKPKDVTAPRAKVAISSKLAPVVASSGTALTAGARDAGTGTGAGGQGGGTGAGGSGNGSGAGGGTKPVKIAGDINSARDYPIASRDLRIDDYVIVAITVGSDGKPSACRVHRPSRDAAANAVTCRLAMQRFRFRPATDAAGTPVEATYGWKQSWHY